MAPVKKCLTQFFVIVFVLIATIMLNYVTKLLMYKMKIVNEDLINSPKQIIVEPDTVILEQTLPQCNCTRGIESFGKSISSGQSSCSKQTLIRGRHQKVIAFTFFVG